MTSPASDIAKYLATATATAALTAGRVYWPFAVTEPALPYACVRLVNWRRIAVDMQGARAPRDFEIEVLCFAASQEQAWSLADAVISDLENHTGTTPATGGTTIRHCFCASASDAVEEGLFSRGIWGVVLTFTVKV